MNLRITPRREPSLPTLYRFGQLKTKKTKKVKSAITFKTMDIDMIGMGPYLSQEATPLANSNL